MFYNVTQATVAIKTYELNLSCLLNLLCLAYIHVHNFIKDFNQLPIDLNFWCNANYTRSLHQWAAG